MSSFVVWGPLPPNPFSLWARLPGPAWADTAVGTHSSAQGPRAFSGSSLLSPTKLCGLVGGPPWQALGDVQKPSVESCLLWRSGW